MRDRAVRPSGSRHDQFPRGDLPRQRAMRIAAQAQKAGWCAADTAPGGLLAAMAAVQGARPADIVAALQPWLADDAWISRRLDDALALVASDPFVLPPLRMFHGAGLGGLILAERGSITLSLMIRPFEIAAADTAVDSHRAVFSPGHGWTRFVRAGSAHIRRYRVAVSETEAGGAFTATHASLCEFRGEQALRDGDIIAIDQGRDCFSLIGGTGDVVMVQLFVQPQSALPLREYDGRTGQLIRVASSQRANSFRQMGFALLRTLGRRDAAPLFAAALVDRDFALRWQVMREFIALDASAALPHLRAMATNDPHPEVRRAASAALDLVESRLAATTTSACPG